MTATVIEPGFVIRDQRVMDALPEGTVIQTGSDAWTKVAGGLWSNNRNNGRWRTADFSINGSLSVRSVPQGAFRLPMQTAEQVKWDFRVGALAAAQAHGVGINEVERSLTEMGIGREDVRALLGRGVTVADEQTRQALPDGSVIYTGTPASPSSFSVFTKKAGQWVHVLGERTFLDGVSTIETVGGDRTRPDWLDREGTEQDAEAIAEFKARAWRVGWALKQRHGWCSTYESIVHNLGVSQADQRNYTARASGFRVGDRVHFETIAGLPVGSVFLWEHADDPSRWGVYVRADGVNNRAGTRLVMNHNVEDHENYKRYMTLVSIGDEAGVADWLIPQAKVQHLPPGTVFSYNGNAEQFVIMGGGTAGQVAAFHLTHRDARGQYEFPSAFGQNPTFTFRRYIA